MEENGDGEDLTPFWVQSGNNVRRAERVRRGVAAVLFSSGLVVFLLLVTAVIFLVFVVPSTISFSAGIFRPNSVKKSWDSLNIVLVLVAVVFGFLSRSINDDKISSFDEFQPSPIKENEAQKSNPSTPNKWFNFPINNEEKSSLSAANQWYEQYQDFQPKMEQKNSILRRSSSSYPDLREFPSSSSSTNWNYGDYQRRFFDDFHVDSSRSSDPPQLLHHRRHRSLEYVDYLASPPQTNTVIVDTLVSKSAEAAEFPAAAPPRSAEMTVEDEEIARKVINESEAVRKERPSRRFYKDMEILNPVSATKPPLPPAEESPPQPEIQESQKRSRERASRKKEWSSRRQNKELLEPTNPITPPPPQAPPPPQKEQRNSKSERRIGGATGSSTKDFLNSLYNNKKKKKQRQRSIDNMDSLLHEAPPPLSFQIPPPSPPPPPPPPPPSVFHTLFSSKKQKRKRTITVTLEPIPPPPPPPPPRAAARKPEPTAQAATLATHKPPKPVKMHISDRLDEASNSGGESPLSRIPPPPPPPPPSFLKNPAWKFVVQGDYVRVNSNNSSRSGSPDLDDTDSDVTPSASGGGDATAFQASPLFCASPDVDTKAESFITNFRAKLKLEKIHSMKKNVGPSSLGPGSGPNRI